jgi:hypothetical protein
VVLHDVPPGAAVMRVWHPYLKAPGNEVARAIVTPRDGAGHESLSVEVRNPPERTGAY